jgi:RHS repeat-associated protein
VETHKDSCTGPVIGRTVNLYDNATSTDDTVNVPIDGNVTEARAYLSDGTYSAQKTTYDEQGRVLTKTDPLGHATNTVYTPATGYPTGGVTVTNALGQATTTWTSPALGEATKVSDANHNVTEKDYDALGRITAVWLPTEPRSGGTPSYTYAYLTPVSGIAAPTGPTLITTKQLQSSSVWLSSYEYDDGFAEPVETQTASPQTGGREVTTTRYDSRGLKALESSTFYNSAAPGSGLLNPAETAIPTYTTTSYDAFEQASAVVTRSAGGELWRSTTTDHGDHTVTVPPTGGQVLTWTDVFDKTTKVQDYLDATRHQDTTYTYTADHHDPATITDPDGNVTSYGYDWLHHRLSETDPDSGVSTTAYDLAGNATSTIDAKGQKISTAYDGLNRQTSTWSGSISTGTQLTGLAYDTAPGGLGQLATSTTYAGGQAYVNAVTAYDARYRVTGRRYTIPATETGLGGTYDFNYGYDQADHQTSITYPAAGGLARETVTENYTAIGLPNTLIGAATYVTGTTFAGDGKLSGRQYSDAVQRQYGYEPTTDRLSTIKTIVNGTAVQNDEYAYDHAGDTTTIVDHVANQDQCFAYDGRQRLISAYTNGSGCSQAADGTGPAPYNLGYTYDGAGDITTASSNGVATGYTYPAPGAGVVRPHAVTAVGSDSYAYDANGDLTSRTVDGIPTTFTWNAFNQLATSTTVGKTSSYVYDAGGDRRVRRDPGRATVFLDGTELTSTNGAAPTATRYYSAAGATVAQRTPSALTWLTADRQGSEDLAITAAGVVTRQRYLPYGGIRGADGQIPGDRGFLGKVRDSATSLDLLGSRYYDATIGKFIMPDPVDNTDNPDSANPYAYAVDNPATTSDPSGLMVPCDSGHGGCGMTGLPGGAKSSSHHSSRHSPRHSSHHSGHVTPYSDWCWGWVCNPDIENIPQVHPAMPCAIGDPNPFCNQYQNIPPPVTAQPPPKKEHHSFWDKVKSKALGVVNSKAWQAVELGLAVCSGWVVCGAAGAAMSTVDATVYAVNGKEAEAIRAAAQIFTYGSGLASARVLKGASKFLGNATADRAVLRATGEPATNSFVESGRQVFRTASSVHLATDLMGYATTIGGAGGNIVSILGYAK